jgi:hypothetical protein
MTITDTRNPTRQPDVMDAEDILLAGLTRFTAERVRKAIRNAIDLGRARDEALARHDADDNAFRVMQPCDHPGLTEPYSCSYCAASADLDRQARNLDRMDQMLERRF